MCLNNKFSHQLYGFLIIFSLSGCQRTDLVKIADAYLFNDESFQSVEPLTSHIVSDDFIGNPVHLTQVDSFLYVVDSRLDSLVHKFENNIYKGMAIGKGNGPNELLSTGDITPSTDKKTVWAHDISSQQWMQFDRELNAVTDKIQFKDMIENVYIYRPQWISDSLFVCVNFNSHKERFYIVNRNLTDATPVLNPQFTFDDRLPAFLMNDIFSSLIDVSPDRKKVVLAGRYLDCIEIYNIDGSLIKLLKGPEPGFNFEYDQSRSLGRGTLVKSPKSRRAYIGLRSTNDRIYALYSGKERMDSSNYSTSNIIYTFDWEGNLLKKHVLDCRIGSFDVNASTQTIYAVQEPEGCIVGFDQ